MKMLKTFAAGLALIALTSCGNTMTQGGATENALCQLWGESLPTRSKSDTPQTKNEIQEAYADFVIACPQWEHLVP